MEARLAFVHALSPLHAGTGQGIGVIDLPIAREKATGIPFLPGSSVKGSLRDLCDTANQEKIFGTANNTANQTMEHAGSVQFSDQRLLLLPIRSLVGTFAWVTSPYILQRFVRDAKVAGISINNKIPTPKTDQICLTTSPPSCLKYSNTNKVYLEDLDLTFINNNNDNVETDKWANWLAPRIFADSTEWQDMLKKRFCIVSDDLLSFLLETATEVSARIVINDDSKTADNLWYEETLPTETILSGLVIANPTKKANVSATDVFKTITTITNKTVQFGGKATVGHGLCSVKLVKE